MYLKHFKTHTNQPISAIWQNGGKGNLSLCFIYTNQTPKLAQLNQQLYWYNGVNSICPCFSKRLLLIHLCWFLSSVGILSMLVHPKCPKTSPSLSGHPTTPVHDTNQSPYPPKPAWHQYRRLDWLWRHLPK